jgi:hypothetical protein
MVKGIGSSCRHGGNPQKPQTEIGELRAQARPYGGSAATKQTKEAADQLIEHCVTFLNAMDCLWQLTHSI